MRAYAEETNRLNRERRRSAETNRRELAETAKAIAEIVRVIEQGGWHRALSERLTELETRQDSLRAARRYPAGRSRPSSRHRRNLQAQNRVFDRNAFPTRPRARSRRHHSRDHRPRCGHPRRETRQPQHHPGVRAWHHPRLDRSQRKTRLKTQDRHHSTPFVGLGRCPGLSRASATFSFYWILVDPRHKATAVRFK
jgi:hypothetical protein